MYALVRRLLDEGVPVHGVGLQMHLRATRPPEPAAITANVARLRALGLVVRISEMDVRIRRVRQGDPLARQRLVYQDAIAACVGMSGFTDVTFWGVTDAHSWIHRAFGKDAPLLFDRRLRAETRLLRRARRAGSGSEGHGPVGPERPAGGGAGPEVGVDETDPG